jgi:hypothetical protein
VEPSSTCKSSNVPLGLLRDLVNDVAGSVDSVTGEARIEINKKQTAAVRSPSAHHVRVTSVLAPVDALQGLRDAAAHRKSLVRQRGKDASRAVKVSEGGSERE